MRFARLTHILFQQAEALGDQFLAALGVNTSHLSQKGEKEDKKAPIWQTARKPKEQARSFRCTDYAKWKSMTRCVNR